MSTQYWRPVSFKDQEVWAECDVEGALLPRKGRVRIAYREGANKAYATFEDRLQVVDGSALSEFTIPLDGSAG
ncbi:MAG: hypothetical protein VX498_01000, partial [Myxococcota bacterium]|nr:hypothetical protein [Myxococcota bacterium]